MDSKELARILQGRQYSLGVSKSLIAEAKASGLVIVTGNGDDTICFFGAIYDEISCRRGGVAYVESCSQVAYEDEMAMSEVGEARQAIHAVWNAQGYSWIYETQMPHETFEILDGSDLYCRGIVFSLADASLLYKQEFDCLSRIHQHENHYNSAR